tara:strand:+ start:3342 stop:3833 length:492 start_codon:yes stop_codon:yes gene_type:complete
MNQSIYPTSNQDLSSEYPSKYDQQYKDFEFLPCVLYSTQFEDEYKKYKMGRFKGFHTKVTSAGTLLLSLYKTHPDSFDIAKTHFWFKETDPRSKYRKQDFVINLFRGRLWINKYPMYLKYLYLLYYQKANTNNPLTSDSLYSISQYLKPKRIFDYEILWDNWR